MHFKQTWAKKWAGIGIGLTLTTGLGVFLNTFTAGLSLKNSSYDLLLIARGEIPATEAALVYLDEESHTRLGQPLNIPWDRSLHAQLVDRLTELGARAIVFDIVFSDPSVRGPEVDDLFAASLQASGRVILAADNVRTGYKQSAIYPPIEQLETNSAGIGTAELIPSPDLIVRRHTTGDPTYDVPSLAVATARFLNLPVTGGDRWMNYYGPANFLPSRSYHELFLPEAATNNIFQDKVVFVGARILTKFAGERKDEYPNPFSYWRQAESEQDGLFMAGVELQAIAFLNLLRSDWLTTTSLLTQQVLFIAIGLLFGAGMLLLRPWLAAITALSSAALLLLVSYLLFRQKLIWFPWLIPLVQIGVALGWSIVFNSIQLYVQKRLLEQTLSMYLSPKLVKKFARDPKWLRPGAEQQELTVLFSDIEGFTSFSEGMDPDRLASFMNGYFQEAVNGCIHPTNGTVVKYIGDAIFAFWNAPEEQADHASRACRAAVLLGRQHQLEIDGRPIVTRIGLHTGSANVGNFGSTERVDYTAFGESINLASRMEGLNKYLGTNLVITGATKERIGDEFTTRFAGQFRLKGFEKPVAVHELLGMKEDAAESRAWREAFAEALNLYKLKNFDAAETAFLKVLDLRKQDGPSRFYLSKIAAWRANPLPLADTRTEETHMADK